MKCPHCNAPTEVVRVHQQTTGYSRWRLCFNGHKFKTREVVVKGETHGGARRGKGKE